MNNFKTWKLHYNWLENVFRSFKTFCNITPGSHIFSPFPYFFPQILTKPTTNRQGSLVPLGKFLLRPLPAWSENLDYQHRWVESVWQTWTLLPPAARQTWESRRRRAFLGRGKNSSTKCIHAAVVCRRDHWLLITEGGFWVCFCCATKYLEAMTNCFSYNRGWAR